MTASSRPVAVVQGEFRVTADPGVTLATLLGSCVAACIWDPGPAGSGGPGGMNHFLLPRHEGAQTGTADTRYGVHAMELLINALLKAGARRNRLAAKLFGGARMSAGRLDIGAANADFARVYLATEGIPLRAESLGGQQARRVMFHPASGHVRQLLLPAATVPETLPAALPVSSEVVIF
jgi:chemotaxis protein CheD